jgi:cell division protein FtsL
MGRLALVLGVLLMFAAMSLVTARYQSRNLFIQNERLLRYATEIDVGWRQLQLDRAELSGNARVDRIARDQLGMVPISPKRTLYIRDVVTQTAEGGN